MTQASYSHSKHHADIDHYREQEREDMARIQSKLFDDSTHKQSVRSWDAAEEIREINARYGINLPIDSVPICSPTADDPAEANCISIWTGIVLGGLFTLVFYLSMFHMP